MGVEFYAPECLKEFNGTTHVVNKRVFQRIVERRWLDNASLKEIRAEDIRMFYYNHANTAQDFVIVTEKKPVRG